MTDLDSAEFYGRDKPLIAPVAILALAAIIAYVWPEERPPSKDGSRRRQSKVSAAGRTRRDAGRSADSRPTFRRKAGRTSFSGHTNRSGRTGFSP